LRAEPGLASARIRRASSDLHRPEHGPLRTAHRVGGRLRGGRFSWLGCDGGRV